MMQIFKMEKKNVLNNRRNDESMYKSQFDSTHKDIEKNCAKNKFYYKYENHRYYNGKLKNTFVRRAIGTSSKIICDEYVIDRRLNLQQMQQFEHMFAENTNCRRIWPNYKSTNSSKLTLAMTILKTLKATYWVHYRIICEQTNVLLHAKVTSNYRNMYNVRCAHILCCRQLNQRSIIGIHTALNVLQAINRLIQRSLQLIYVMFITLIMLMQVKYTTQLLSTKAAPAASNDTILQPTENIGSITIYKDNNNNKYQTVGRDSDTGLLLVTKSGVSTGLSNAYLDKLDNLERSLAAVLIKVAYGTTSTTKRSIPDNNYVPSLTTVATPLLTTLRYQNKQSQLKYHRNYELDLERDHALPTSAPNADILKSNSNPTYPNPNRQHMYNRERQRHVLNSTPLPLLPNDLKETNGRLPTISLLSGVLPPHYSPPARSFFTPPLPPEYQHPFADKPTLRGTNDEGAIVTNAATFVQRRPIPPPSLMPGHERIPFRPGDVLISSSAPYVTSDFPLLSTGLFRSTAIPIKIGKLDVERKKNLNMPSKSSTLLEKNKGGEVKVVTYGGDVYDKDLKKSASNQVQIIKEVLPSIRRILSGSKGRKSDVPDVLLKRVTISSKESMHQQSPSSSIVLFNSTPSFKNDVEDINVYSGDKITAFYNTNINKSVVMKITHNLASGLSGDFLNTQLTFNHNQIIASTAEAIPAFESNNKTTSSTSILISNTTDFSSSANNKSVKGEDGGSSSSTSTLASNGFINGTWNVAWNIHVYLSVILFTVLAVYSLYKMITYNKLTHLFAQSYFVCIHLVLIIICTMRIFYLCYDAYNIHASLPIFISEILLNLPSTFLTISFSVLILFLSLKSLNHKNNRYSALIRPLTVVIGCGVHIILCITLHYVESYTFHQHYQQHFIYQQQQQLLRRQQVQLQQQNHYVHPNFQQNLYQQFVPSTLNNLSAYGNQQVGPLQLPIIMSANIAAAPPPPRVLSLICQIIYIFVCFSLGFLYLYMYRILKRILRNKSQNYIHGYQNLSYAIHISIATALLYILLAVIQLVGAISITSTSRLIISQINTDIDWMQWGFQFSIRLIEIAIITLTSWVAGLTNNGGGSSINGGNSNVGISHGETPLCINISTRGSRREKPLSTHQQSQHQNHSTVAGFFLPCTYTSSQEHFETDYPVVCNANSNIHTYTMRTGKLIYEDSFVLNSMAGNNASGDVAIVKADGELQNSEYNSGSTSNHNVIDCSSHHSCKQQSQYFDYFTDNNTDHYENPNFDLRDSGPTLHLPNNDENLANQKFPENSMTSTKGLSNESNFGSNTNSDLLLQSGGSYSEPCPQTYKYSKFECSTFEKSHEQSIPHTWVETPIQNMFIKRGGKKTFNASECNEYEKTERRSASSSYFGSGNGNSRFANYNTYELSSHNSSVRKSETLNTIVNTKHGRNASSSSAASSTSTCGPRSTASDVLSKVTLSDNRYNHHQNHSYQMTNGKGSWVNHYVMPQINTQQYLASSNTVFNGRCATSERTNFVESQKVTKSNGVNALAYSDEDDDEFTLSVSSNHQL